MKQWCPLYVFLYCYSFGWNAPFQLYVLPLSQLNDVKKWKIYNDYIQPHLMVLWHNVSQQSITMTRWRLKSPASRLFTQSLIQTPIKENINAPHHWHLRGEFTGDPAQMASKAENVSIWWRHHGRPVFQCSILPRKCHFTPTYPVPWTPPGNTFGYNALHQL